VRRVELVADGSENLMQPGALPAISGLILSGGQGSRLGGADKGLQPIGGQPVIARVIQRFAPQVGEVIISANRNVERYAAFGHRIVQDRLGEGPLAGMHAGLCAASHEFLATVPCDAPALPLDLVARLWSSLSAQRADLAVASTGGFAQPVFILVRKAALPHLADYLEQGGRKADGWYNRIRTVRVPFDDQAAAFANLNDAGDFSAFERGV
jgi:molybdopterin-guanine dinucleotide biosynthesis protein A